MEWEQLTSQPALLGEGPCWHGDEQRLYWVDILGKKLHRYDPASGEDRHWSVGDYLGCVAPRQRDGLILALKNRLAFFDPRTAKLQRLDPIETDEQTRFNDGKCDPAGRFWVGSMDMVEEARPLGTLYRVDPDGSVHAMDHKITISNGLAWSPDQTTMYYVDSPTKTVSAFDYSAASGDIANKRPVIQLNSEQGFPDGMTIDSEGMIWLAHWAGQRICRWDPLRGEVVEEFPTPAPHTSCCCFGGPDLSDLYVTTARKGLTPDQLNSYPQSGHLFRMKTNVAGMPTFAYAG